MQQTPERILLRPLVFIKLILFQNCRAPQANVIVTQT